MARKCSLGLLFLVALCAFTFRFGERDVRAAEKVPNACPLGCRDVYAWWNGTDCYGAEIQGTTTPAVNTRSTYAPGGNLAATAVNNLTPTNTTLMVDKWSYADFTKTCGKNGDQWQLPQEVSPIGAPKAIMNPTITQKTCQ